MLPTSEQKNKTDPRETLLLSLSLTLSRTQEDGRLINQTLLGQWPFQGWIQFAWYFFFANLLIAVFIAKWRWEKFDKSWEDQKSLGLNFFIRFEEKYGRKREDSSKDFTLTRKNIFPPLTSKRIFRGSRRLPLLFSICSAQTWSSLWPIFYPQKVPKASFKVKVFSCFIAEESWKRPYARIILRLTIFKQKA